MRCSMQIGRLVSHPCGRRTRNECVSCGKPTCPDHLASSGSARCVRCEGTYEPPEAPVSVSWEEMWDFPAEDVRAFDSRSGGPSDGLHELDS